MKNGFSLKELVIKRQHNCKTTGFWYKNSIKYNFLLLAHEYLAVFKKYSPKKQHPIEIEEPTRSFKPIEIEELESTTVWIFEHKNWYNMTIQNLIERYNSKEYCIINGFDDFNKLNNIHKLLSLIVISCTTHKIMEAICNNINEILNSIQDNGYLAIICNDERLKDGTIYSTGIKLEKTLKGRKELKIKELVVISIENNNSEIDHGEDLEISHKYMLIYRVNKGG